MRTAFSFRLFPLGSHAPTLLNMKKFGLVGGIGPSSTLDYYRVLTSEYQKVFGGENFPPMIIDSLNLAVFYDLAEKKDWSNFRDGLLESIQNLAAGGAEFAAMAANTAHIVFDELQARSPIPLISIVEATCRASQTANCQKVIVLGTAFTMSSGLYTRAFREFGIEALVPDPADQQAVHGIIFPNLQQGIVVPEEKNQIIEIVNSMTALHHADGVILACTELSLILNPEDVEIQVIDSTAAHIDEILKAILENTPQ